MPISDDVQSIASIYQKVLFHESHKTMWKNGRKIYSGVEKKDDLEQIYKQRMRWNCQHMFRRMKDKLRRNWPKAENHILGKISKKI